MAQEDSPCGSSVWQPGNRPCLMFQTQSVGRTGGSFCPVAAPQLQDTSLPFCSNSFASSGVKINRHVQVSVPPENFSRPFDPQTVEGRCAMSEQVLRLWSLQGHTGAQLLPLFHSEGIFNLMVILELLLNLPIYFFLILFKFKTFTELKSWLYKAFWTYVQILLCLWLPGRLWEQGNKSHYWDAPFSLVDEGRFHFKMQTGWPGRDLGTLCIGLCILNKYQRAP